MRQSMVDIQPAAAEIRRGIKKKIEEDRNYRAKNIMSASAKQGGHNYINMPTFCDECHLEGLLC